MPPGHRVVDHRGVDLTGPDGPVRAHVWSVPGPSTAGAGGVPVLLAMHGWTDSGEVFGPLAHRLEVPCTVIAPDAPAHGQTPVRAGDFVVADHAISALAVLDQLGDGAPVVILGHSMGALTAARVAAARPDAVTALVLEDPALSTGHRPQSAGLMRAWIEGLRTGGTEGMTAWVAGEHPDWPADERPSWVASKASVDVRHMTRRIDWGEPLPALLSEVAAPVTLVVGETGRGGIVPATAARRCAAVCAGGCRLVTLPVGHCPRREAPARFAELVTEALRTSVRPPKRRRRSR